MITSPTKCITKLCLIIAKQTNKQTSFITSGAWEKYLKLLKKKKKMLSQLSEGDKRCTVETSDYSASLLASKRCRTRWQ